ncbi:MAG: GlsB/YeaQ/YmgE family stress response membrane protein [Verrucomicrobiaceae bacterium]|jgi:uncharacterized membrane protein YeaQ/YmgE (transglycosylase-associated protein family)|nr:GlsB/YeaQ/YmgE family stress response membrane protein [Verrucomicrobiaceae bacterium]
MGIISWILFGLFVGIVAKFLMPGKDGGGFIITTLLGIVGSFVGGWISTLLGYGRVDTYSAPSMLMAILGAILVLFIHRKVSKR